MKGCVAPPAFSSFLDTADKLLKKFPRAGESPAEGHNLSPLDLLSLLIVAR